MAESRTLCREGRRSRNRSGGACSCPATKSAAPAWWSHGASAASSSCPCHNLLHEQLAGEEGIGGRYGLGEFLAAHPVNAHALAPGGGADVAGLLAHPARGAVPGNADGRGMMVMRRQHGDSAPRCLEMANPPELPDTWDFQAEHAPAKGEVRPDGCAGHILDDPGTRSPHPQNPRQGRVN